MSARSEAPQPASTLMAVRQIAISRNTDQIVSAPSTKRAGQRPAIDSTALSPRWPSPRNSTHGRSAAVCTRYLDPDCIWPFCRDRWLHQMLIEAAWHHRKPYRPSQRLRQRYELPHPRSEHMGTPPTTVCMLDGFASISRCGRRFVDQIGRVAAPNGRRRFTLPLDKPAPHIRTAVVCCTGRRGRR